MDNIFNILIVSFMVVTNILYFINKFELQQTKKKLKELEKELKELK